MTEDLTMNVCPNCKKKSEQVINTEKHIRVGWYCPACRYLVKKRYCAKAKCRGLKMKKLFTHDDEEGAITASAFIKITTPSGDVGLTDVQGYP